MGVGVRRNKQPAVFLIFPDTPHPVNFDQVTVINNLHRCADINQQADKHKHGHPAQQIHHVVPLYPHYGHRENRQCERNFFNGIPRPGPHKGGDGIQVIPQPLTTGNHINFIHSVLPPK